MVLRIEFLERAYKADNNKYEYFNSCDKLNLTILTLYLYVLNNKII